MIGLLETSPDVVHGALQTRRAQPAYKTILAVLAEPAVELKVWSRPAQNGAVRFNFL